MYCFPNAPVARRFSRLISTCGLQIGYRDFDASVRLHLFCCKDPKLLERWYNDVFAWLFKCENIFGFKNLKGYETGRIYAYLAERYLPFWF